MVLKFKPKNLSSNLSLAFYQRDKHLLKQTNGADPLRTLPATQNHFIPTEKQEVGGRIKWYQVTNDLMEKMRRPLLENKGHFYFWHLTI